MPRFVCIISDTKLQTDFARGATITTFYLANNVTRTQKHNYLCQECGGYRQEYGRIEVDSFYSREERGRWWQGMTPRRSSGCGACISELTTRRHRGRLSCLGSRAKASTLHGRQRRFIDDFAFHTSFLGLFSLLATQQKWYHPQQQIVQSLILHN